MSFWTLGANVVLWLKGGGWLFQSNPSIAKGLWTFHMMILLRWGMGSGLSSQPVDRLVKKALCRKSPILHAYYSSLLFHLDLPPFLLQHNLHQIMHSKKKKISIISYLFLFLTTTFTSETTVRDYSNHFSQFHHIGHWDKKRGTTHSVPRNSVL